jgi:hypothetical protein
MSNLENQSTKTKTMWRWWAKALGEKASKCDRESDTIARIRTFIFTTYLVTNCFIVAGVIRHWNDETQIIIEIEMQEPTVPNALMTQNRVGEFE